MRTAVFVATFDSQLKWCSTIRDALQRRGYECRVTVPDVRSALSRLQVAAAGFDRVEHKSWTDTIDDATESNVVVSSLTGPLTRSLFLDVKAGAAAKKIRPPVTASGWVGLIVERITAGFLDRAFLDVIAVNDKDDWEYFHEVAQALDLPTDGLLLCGLPFLSTNPMPQRTGPIKKVLFADQPTMPSAKGQRLYLYEKLIEYAIRHPDREVQLKPRHRPGENTLHEAKYPPERLLRGRDLPKNFTITYEPISDVIDQTDLLLTLSSTACLEAIDAGCRVGLIADLGVNERFGNQVFLQSGLLRTFEQIREDDIGAPTREWISRYFGLGIESPSDVVAKRCDDLVRRGERPSDAAMSTSYFSAIQDAAPILPGAYDPKTSHGYLRKVGKLVGPIIPPLMYGAVRDIAKKLAEKSPGGVRR